MTNRSYHQPQRAYIPIFRRKEFSILATGWLLMAESIAYTAKHFGFEKNACLFCGRLADFLPSISAFSLASAYQDEMYYVAVFCMACWPIQLYFLFRYVPIVAAQRELQSIGSISVILIALVMAAYLCFVFVNDPSGPPVGAIHRLYHDRLFFAAFLCSSCFTMFNACLFTTIHHLNAIRKSEV